jgi:hypothetical protein
VLGRISLLVSGVPPGGEASALRDVQQLLEDHSHTTPFESTPAPTAAATAAPAAAATAAPAGDSAAAGSSGSSGRQQQQQQQRVSVFEAAVGNLGALERSLAGWEKRLRSHHTPSRVLKWTSSSGIS